MLFVLLGLTEHIDSIRPVSNASRYCTRWCLVLSEYAGELTEGTDTSLSTFERGRSELCLLVVLGIENALFLAGSILINVSGNE